MMCFISKQHPSDTSEVQTTKTNLLQPQSPHLLFSGQAAHLLRTDPWTPLFDGSEPHLEEMMNGTCKDGRVDF